MLRKKRLIVLSLLLLSSLIGCSTKKDVIVRTEYIKPKIDIQARPEPLQLHDVEFYAVSSKNFEEFLRRYKEENGDLVFLAMSVIDYENMALNLANIRRYLLQQKSLIQYYENSIMQIDTTESLKQKED